MTARQRQCLSRKLGGNTRQRQCLSDEGRGNTRQRQCLSNEGRGNTRQRQCLSNEGNGNTRQRQCLSRKRGGNARQRQCLRNECSGKTRQRHCLTETIELACCQRSEWPGGRDIDEKRCTVHRRPQPLHSRRQHRQQWTSFCQESRHRAPSALSISVALSGSAGSNGASRSHLATASAPPGPIRCHRTSIPPPPRSLYTPAHSCSQRHGLLRHCQWKSEPRRTTQPPPALVPPPSTPPPTLVCLSAPPGSARPPLDLCRAASSQQILTRHGTKHGQSDSCCSLGPKWWECPAGTDTKEPACAPSLLSLLLVVVLLLSLSLLSSSVLCAACSGATANHLPAETPRA